MSRVKSTKSNDRKKERGHVTDINFNPSAPQGLVTRFYSLFIGALIAACSLNTYEFHSWLFFRIIV